MPNVPQTSGDHCSTGGSRTDSTLPFLAGYPPLPPAPTACKECFTKKGQSMAAEAAGSDLIQVVALLAAGVVAVPIFKRMGLGSILGYLAAGVVIGPFGL